MLKRVTTMLSSSTSSSPLFSTEFLRLQKSISKISRPDLDLADLNIEVGHFPLPLTDSCHYTVPVLNFLYPYFHTLFNDILCSTATTIKLIILKLQSGMDIRVKILCLTLTLVNVKDNVNKTSKTFRPNNFGLHRFFKKPTE